MESTKTILVGHVSPETAYVVDDYPYGFRLRCKIRYWLDCDPKKGARLMSQTTNPKAAGVVWNKPKASTYCRFAGAMYLHDKGHVQWAGLHEYMDNAQTQAWFAEYASGCPDVLVPLMKAWVARKAAYEKIKDSLASKEAA